MGRCYTHEIRILLRTNIGSPGECISHNTVFSPLPFSKIGIISGFEAVILIKRENSCTIRPSGNEKSIKRFSHVSRSMAPVLNAMAFYVDLFISTSIDIDMKVRL